MCSVKSSVSGDVQSEKTCISVRDIHTAPSFAAHQHAIEAEPLGQRHTCHYSDLTNFLRLQNPPAVTTLTYVFWFGQQ